MRVGGARAPPNSQHETPTTHPRRDHQEAARGSHALGRRPERGGRLQKAGSQPADLSPLAAGIRRSQGGDSQTAKGFGEGERPAQEAGGEPGTGPLDPQGGGGGSRVERDSQKALRLCPQGSTGGCWQHGRPGAQTTSRAACAAGAGSERTPGLHHDPTAEGHATLPWAQAWQGCGAGRGAAAQRCVTSASGSAAWPRPCCGGPGWRSTPSVCSGGGGRRA